MTDVNLITVSEFKTLMPQMPVTSYTDPTISGMISAASRMVSDYLEYTPLAENITGETKLGQITTDGDLLIFVQKPPIQSVVSVAITRGTNTITLQSTDPSTGVNRYNIDYTGRNLRYPYEQVTLQGSPILMNFLSLRGAIFYTLMSYRGGFEVASLPQSIKQAAAFFTADLLANQFNMMGATSLHQGQVSYGFNGKNGESRFSLQAKRLLGPYRRMSI